MQIKFANRIFSDLILDKSHKFWYLIERLLKVWFSVFWCQSESWKSDFRTIYNRWISSIYRTKISLKLLLRNSEKILALFLVRIDLKRTILVSLLIQMNPILSSEKDKYEFSVYLNFGLIWYINLINTDSEDLFLGSMEKLKNEWKVCRSEYSL